MEPSKPSINQRTIPPIIGQILAGRGMAPEEMTAFLWPNYDEHLHDPLLLTDMSAAVERIVAAMERGERVAIYGDYDIDGITATAIMLETMAHLGIEAMSYIPDRFEEGYGINQEALSQLKRQGFDLVISVDCGITSVQEAAWARDNGLDLIITDHHAVPEIIPEAVAVVNPKRPGDAYPFKDLCGAGVAFKLAQALQLATKKPEAGQEKWLLDLVALGTVCDVVSLVGENRVLASFGLKVMRRTRRVGLKALAAVGGVDIQNITSHHLGFVLGPRMNAAGRLEHAARSLELMVTQDATRAAAIAVELDELNRERRATQDAIFAEANDQAAAYANDPVLVLSAPGWNHGVVGIVASKLVEKWHKPVLVAEEMGEFTKGSARSAGSYNMVEALRANSHLLTKFGGHFFAAGYTLPTERLGQLRQGLIQYYKDSGAGGERVVVEADVQLPDLTQADWPLLEELELLQPYGSSNPEPLLAAEGLKIASLRRIGKDQSHLKLRLCDPSGRALEAIGFGLCERYPDLAEGVIVSAKFRLSQNEYLGRTSLQLVVVELGL